MTSNPGRERMWKLLFKTVDSLRNCQAGNRLDAEPRLVTIAQFQVMGCIFFPQTGTVKIKDIAKELGITSGAVSQIVDTLARAGLVERRIPEDDRRSVSITLSPAGLRIRSAIDASFDAMLTQLLAPVPEEKQQVFLEVLETLAGGLAEWKRSPGAAVGKAVEP